MNRAPAFSPVLQLAPLAAALVIAVAIYAALIGAWRKTARWLRGWWRSRHPVHAAPGSGTTRSSSASQPTRGSTPRSARHRGRTPRNPRTCRSQ